MRTAREWAGDVCQDDILISDGVKIVNAIRRECYEDSADLAYKLWTDATKDMDDPRDAIMSRCNEVCRGAENQAPKV